MPAIRRARRFTLLEMLLTLTLSLALLALVMPMFSSARAKARYVRWVTYKENNRVDEDLVAYYDFEGGPVREDGARLVRNKATSADTGNVYTPENLDGSLGAHVIPAIGRWQGKWALYFGGFSGCHVDCGNDSALDLTEAMTVTAWVKPQQHYTTGYICARNIDSYADMQYGMLLFHDGRLLVKVDSVGFDTGCRVPRETWTHVAFTATGGGQVRVYLNGQPAAKTACPAIHTSQGSFCIGARYDATGHTLSFKGTIGEIAVYQRALTDSDISDMFAMGRP